MCERKPVVGHIRWCKHALGGATKLCLNPSTTCRVLLRCLADGCLKRAPPNLLVSVGLAWGGCKLSILGHVLHNKCG